VSRTGRHSKEREIITNRKIYNKKKKEKGVREDREKIEKSGRDRLRDRKRERCRQRHSHTQREIRTEKHTYRNTHTARERERESEREE